MGPLVKSQIQTNTQKEPTSRFSSLLLFKKRSISTVRIDRFCFDVIDVKSGM